MATNKKRGPAKPFIDKRHRPLSAKKLSHRDITLRQTPLGTALVSFIVTEDSAGAEKVYEIDIDVPPPNPPTMPLSDFDKPHGDFPVLYIAQNLLPQMTFGVKETSTTNRTSYTVTATVTASVPDPDLKTPIGDLTLLKVGNLLGQFEFAVAGKTYTISGDKAQNAGSQAPPYLSKGPTLGLAHGNLPPAAVLKLLELLEFTVALVSGPGRARPRGRRRFATSIAYSLRPKIHCE